MNAAPDPDLLFDRFLAVLSQANPSHILVAVSGGSDSMALLDLLEMYARARGIMVSAATVDHGLRDGAAQEAEAVAVHCAAQGVPHVTLKWSGWDGSGNLQAEARQGRYALLANHAQAISADAIALGHTEDDQAETMLMRLGRKSGLEGLAEMDDRFKRHGVTWVRPLLQHSREQLRSYLSRREIAWAEDPSNSDPRFDRVQTRGTLQHLAGLGITSAGLAESSRHLGTAEQALKHYLVAEACRHVRSEKGDLVFPHSLPVPDEIRRRIVVGALQWIGREPYPPRGRALLELDANMAESGTHTLAGCLISLENDFVRVTREWNAVKTVRAEPEAAWDGRWQVKGPHKDGLEIRALGEAGLALCPDWRESGLPRRSLIASPAVWQGDGLIAAPLAGLGNGWKAHLTQSYEEFLAG